MYLNLGNYETIRRAFPKCPSYEFPEPPSENVLDSSVETGAQLLLKAG